MKVQVREEKVMVTYDGGWTAVPSSDTAKPVSPALAAWLEGYDEDIPDVWNGLRVYIGTGGYATVEVPRYILPHDVQDEQQQVETLVSHCQRCDEWDAPTIERLAEICGFWWDWQAAKSDGGNVYKILVKIEKMLGVEL